MLLISLTEFSLREYSNIFSCRSSTIAKITKLKHARQFAEVNSNSSVAAKHLDRDFTAWFRISSLRTKLVLRRASASFRNRFAAKFPWLDGATATGFEPSSELLLLLMLPGSEYPDLCHWINQFTEPAINSRILKLVSKGCLPVIESMCNNVFHPIMVWIFFALLLRISVVDSAMRSQHVSRMSLSSFHVAFIVLKMRSSGVLSNRSAEEERSLTAILKSAITAFSAKGQGEKRGNCDTMPRHSWNCGQNDENR